MAFSHGTNDAQKTMGIITLSLFTATQDALQQVLPHATRVVLSGLNHGAAQDQGGNPAVIAGQLRQFFS